jgi:hypothetical protein
MVREDKSSSAGPYSEDSQGKSGSEEAGSLAARRARLRGSLTKSSSPPPAAPVPDPVDDSTDSEQMSGADDSAPSRHTSQTAHGSASHATSAKHASEDKKSQSTGKSAPSIHGVQQRRSEAPAEGDSAASHGHSHKPSSAQSESEKGAHDSSPSASSPVVPPSSEANPSKSSSAVQEVAHVPDEALEVLHSIDDAMNVCATNLASLQRISSEHTNALKTLSETLNNQTFAEMGLNLSSLMESLSAALEPMKAAGELVPAIDQLVQSMEGRQSSSSQSNLTNEELVANLADQLSAGLIDPWTFKCAYMAIYPTEHPADLLHRLADLLGTQRLSGDLFRTAYEAIQAADGPAISPPLRASTIFGAEEEADLDDLQRADGHRQEELLKRLEDKERELVESKEALDTRWQEMNSQYQELTSALSERDMELKHRTAEVVQKDSENQQLKAQLEELRDQTKDLVADLQNQLMLSKEAKKEPTLQLKASPSFFDVSPTASSSPFDTPVNRPFFDDKQNSVVEPSQIVDAAPNTAANSPVPQTETAPEPALQDTVQMPKPTPTPSPTPAQTRQPAASARQPQTPASAFPVNHLAAARQPVETIATPAAASPTPTASRVSSTAPTTPLAPGAGSYGSGVRAQVFEVIVRQALAGAPWKEICAGPMQVNNISPEEVEAEVKRRQALLKK